MPPEDINQPSGQAPSENGQPTTPPAGSPAQEPPAPAAPKVEPQAGSRKDDEDAPISLREAKKLRNEIEQWKQKLAERDTEIAKRDAAIRDANLRQRVEARRQELGLPASTDTVVKLMDRSKIKFDDAGLPVNHVEVLDELIASEPLLQIKTITPPPARGGRPVDTEAATAITDINDLKGKSYSEINAYLDKRRAARGR